MITTNSKNKKASEQTDYNPVPTPYFSSSGSRRSFFEEFGSGPREPFYFGPILPDLSDIREIILEKNKTPIELGFSLKSDPCITAIVPSNISGDKKSIFDQHGHVFGSGNQPSTETCGKVRAKVMCSEEYNHEYYYKHERCNNPDCPTCYSKFAHKLANRVVARVTGYTTVYPEDKVDHVVLWPHVMTGYRNMSEAFADVHRMLARMGAHSASVLYHPHRIRGDIKAQLRRYRKSAGISDGIGFWEMAHDDVLDLGGLEQYVEYGPHFHAFTTGYLMNVVDYAKLGMGGYKKVRRISSVYDLERVSYYLSTHTCWEPGHQAVRYYGKISTSKLAKGYPRERIEDVVCTVCGKPMVEHYCDDADVLLGIAHDYVTKKVISYMYWKRGMKPQVPVYQEFQDVLPIGVASTTPSSSSSAGASAGASGGGGVVASPPSLCADFTVPIPRCLSCGRLMHKHERFERGYKYCYTCANTECASPTAGSVVWYDSYDRVTTPPLKSGLGSKL